MHSAHRLPHRLALGTALILAAGGVSITVGPSARADLLAPW